MDTFSAYVFRQALGPLLGILGALAAVALLTQGLSQLDLIIANRAAGFAFAWITLLAIPQLVSLILPLAVFFAVIYALNRMHNDSEIAVAYSAGASRRRIARPIMQMAFLAALAHLTIATMIQPWALRERRETLYAVRADVASSLVQEGAFTFPSNGLTIYARERGGGGVMRDLLIHDARGSHEVTYTARTGAITTAMGPPTITTEDGRTMPLTFETVSSVELRDGRVEQLAFDEPRGADGQDRLQALTGISKLTLRDGRELQVVTEYPPTIMTPDGKVQRATFENVSTIVMRTGQVQRQTEDGKIEILDFDRYDLPVGDFSEDSQQFLLKASDRYLRELFYPDLTAHYDQTNVNRFLAEGNARLAGPLLNIAMAMVALASMLSGQFSRRGYVRGIIVASVFALVLRLTTLAATEASIDDPDMNIVQYLLPLSAMFVANIMLGGRRARKKRLEMGPALTAQA